MKKIIIPGIISGIALLVLSVLGLYIIIWFLPALAMQYFNPAFDVQPHRYMLYYVHPFIISMALSWFWERFKGLLTGSFFMRGIEFGLIYALVALVPVMWLIYSAINVSAAMVATWLVLGLLQGLIVGLICEKMNP